LNVHFSTESRNKNSAKKYITSPVNSLLDFSPVNSLFHNLPVNKIFRTTATPLANVKVFYSKMTTAINGKNSCGYYDMNDI
jgi:hypothetical protein